MRVVPLSAFKHNQTVMRLFDVQQKQWNNREVIQHYSALFGTEVIFFRENKKKLYVRSKYTYLVLIKLTFAKSH